MDCFHEGSTFLVIDPEECIDCTLCEPECPVEAILSEDDLPDGQEHFLELNAELSKEWPVNKRVLTMQLTGSSSLINSSILNAECVE